MDKEEVYNLHSKAYDIINRILVRKTTISERKKLQEIIKILVDSDMIDEKDKENFQFWSRRYERDIAEITNDISIEIQRQKAIIGIAERKIEELRKKLE